jgi:hypothetical protein
MLYQVKCGNPASDHKFQYRRHAKFFMNIPPKLKRCPVPDCGLDFGGVAFHYSVFHGKLMERTAELCLDPTNYEAMPASQRVLKPLRCHG